MLVLIIAGYLYSFIIVYTIIQFLYHHQPRSSKQKKTLFQWTTINVLRSFANLCKWSHMSISNWAIFNDKYSFFYSNKIFSSVRRYCRTIFSPQIINEWLGRYKWIGLLDFSDWSLCFLAPTSMRPRVNATLSQANLCKSIGIAPSYRLMHFYSCYESLNVPRMQWKLSNVRCLPHFLMN